MQQTEQEDSYCTSTRRWKCSSRWPKSITSIVFHTCAHTKTILKNDDHRFGYNHVQAQHLCIQWTVPNWQWIVRCARFQSDQCQVLEFSDASLHMKAFPREAHIRSTRRSIHQHGFPMPSVSLQQHLARGQVQKSHDYNCSYGKNDDVLIVTSELPQHLITFQVNLEGLFVVRELLSWCVHARSSIVSRRQKSWDIQWNLVVYMDNRQEFSLGFSHLYEYRERMSSTSELATTTDGWDETVEIRHEQRHVRKVKQVPWVRTIRYHTSICLRRLPRRRSKKQPRNKTSFFPFLRSWVWIGFCAKVNLSECRLNRF